VAGDAEVKESGKGLLAVGSTLQDDGSGTGPKNEAVKYLVPLAAGVDGVSVRLVNHLAGGGADHINEFGAGSFGHPFSLGPLRSSTLVMTNICSLWCSVLWDG